MLLEVEQVAIEAEGFEFAVSGEQQGASRSFVAAARLDADEAVFDQVDASNRVASADFVQQFDQRHRIEIHTIYGDGHTFFESDFDLFLLIGSLLRRLRHLPGAREGRVGGVLEFPAFVADVPEITIAAVNLLAARGHGNTALLGIVETIFARFQIPLAPRRHDFQLGSERLVGHLEADLVVAFASASVADGRGAFAQRDFHLMFRDHGTGKRGAEQILVFIHRPGFQRGPDVAG